jgi:hypothetical protein
MCTVTWLFEKDGYQLFCNRDELNTRKPALPPTILTQDGVRFIAPEDGDHGGSWIAANEYGLSLCLLNRYSIETKTSSSFVSRGLLIKGLADCRSIAEVLERIEKTSLAPYRPFAILLLEPGAKAIAIEWTGRQAWTELTGPRSLPLTSSSYDTTAVNRSRRVAFYRLAHNANQLDSSTLYRFHSGHSPARGPHSVCMHRSAARTVSFSWVKFRGGLLEFSYFGDSPCLATEGNFLTTTLRTRQLVALRGKDLDSQPLSAGGFPGLNAMMQGL